MKSVLATIVGIFCVGIFMSIMGLAMAVSVALSGDPKPTLEDKSVLRINLAGTLEERAAENPFGKLMGNENVESQGLDDLLTAIRVAKDNDKIKGIYIEGGSLSTDFASLQALRRALMDFKQSKKFVIAYADVYTQGTYYVSSMADQVLVNPYGMIDWKGLSSQPIFFADLLKKVGVKMQVFKVGTFKSAVEPFILTGMSDANRQQVQSFVGDIWGVLVKDVAASRHVSVDSLNAYADRYTTFADPGEYCRMQLADSLCYMDGVRAKLRVLSGADKVNFIAPSDLAKYDKPAKSDNEIAVYYAQGDIVDEAATASFNNQSQIVGSTVVKDLDKLASDDDVKAVVLRINSGGGSAFASEQMWRAVKELKKKKPVVVSMSGMAASGGYYMSCAADYIVAEPTTLTGSIGIFGMVPDASELLRDKLGLHFDVVKTNESADFGAMGRPFNEAEAAAMQTYVNRGYKQFISRVADGRKMTLEQVDKIGQGRVWTGNQALGIKLVDRLGSLQDAVAEAAKRAKVKDYAVGSYPAKESWFDQMMKSTVEKDYLEEKLQTTLGDYYAPLRYVTGLKGRDYLQARIFFEPNIH